MNLTPHLKRMDEGEYEDNYCVAQFSPSMWGDRLEPVMVRQYSEEFTDLPMNWELI